MCKYCNIRCCKICWLLLLNIVALQYDIVRHILFPIDLQM